MDTTAVSTLPFDVRFAVNFQGIRFVCHVMLSSSIAQPNASQRSIVGGLSPASYTVMTLPSYIPVGEGMIASAL